MSFFGCLSLRSFSVRNVIHTHWSILHFVCDFKSYPICIKRHV